MQDDIIVVDFGMLNIVVVMLEVGCICCIFIEVGVEILLIVVFFLVCKGVMKIGLDVVEVLIDVEEGCYMCVLKSVLGMLFLYEQCLIGGQCCSVVDIIVVFLIVLKLCVEVVMGCCFFCVLLGCLVYFYICNFECDVQVEVDLCGCYLVVGFYEVDFLFEFEVVVLVLYVLVEVGLGLIVDIGGGILDFLVFCSGDQGVQILVNYGIWLGGMDFDYVVLMIYVMFVLGYGGMLKCQMGVGVLLVLNVIYLDLVIWVCILFLYIFEICCMVQDMVKLVIEFVVMQCFVIVLDEELGYELVFVVECGKIVVNGGDGGQIVMGFIQFGLMCEVMLQMLEVVLLVYCVELLDVVCDMLVLVNVVFDQIGSVVLVGGFSLMGLVFSVVIEFCLQVVLKCLDVFIVVVDGLVFGMVWLVQLVQVVLKNVCLSVMVWIKKFCVCFDVFGFIWFSLVCRKVMKL